MEIENEIQADSSRKIDMKSLREPRTLAGIAFVLGVVVGLLVLGWWLFPVQWENATPAELRPDLQEDYVRMIIDSYNLRQDEALASRRLSDLGEAAADALAAVAAAPGDQSSDTIAEFQAQLGVVSEDKSTEPDEVGGAIPEAESSPAMDTRQLLLTMCGITAVLGLALGALYFVRTRRGEGSRSTAWQAQDLSKQADQTDYEAMGETAPLSQWMTTYLVGDDLFDDSFSIDSIAGEFLGECGVGIAETIGVGDPKRVSAFEIWLFDKNDIQTVTKVLMSNHTFRDDGARDRLSAKGEPVLANPGVETVLETETLQLVARVVDMDYGEGALPEESFFERITLELAVWSKV